MHSDALATQEVAHLCTVPVSTAEDTFSSQPFVGGVSAKQAVALPWQFMFKEVQHGTFSWPYFRLFIHIKISQVIIQPLH